MVPDVASYLNFAVITQALFSLVYLSSQQWRRNRWLVLVFAVILLLQVGIFLTREELNLSQKILFGNPGMMLWFAPALYMFTRQTVGIKTEAKRIILYFLPGLVFYFVFLASPVIHPGAFVEAIFEGKVMPALFANLIAFILITFYYGYSCLRLLAYNQRKYRQEYAETSIYYNLDWLKYTIIFLLVSTLVALLVVLFVRWIGVVKVSYFLTEGSFLLTAMGLSFFAFRQPTLYASEEPDPEEIATKNATPVIGKPLLTPEEAVALDERLGAYFITEQPYLDQDIRMPELAEKLGVTSNVFSWYLNEHLGKNFFTFINEYRVKRAAELLHDPDFAHYTLEAISGMAGFRSRTTFVNRFKAIMTVTPSVFRRDG